MIRSSSRFLPFLGLLIPSWIAPALHAGTPPTEVPGLVAWYDTKALHSRSRDGAAVERWVDTSGNGHDLKGTWVTDPIVFHTQRLNNRPTVTVSEDAVFDVAQPFDLDDHTIFLVSASKFTKRALLRSESDPKSGIVLHHEGRFHLYQNGKAGDRKYNRSTPLSREFGITTLGRVDGQMRAFVDGVDFSAGIVFDRTIRVGRFFEIEHTTFVDSDGEGLEIAEMIFFDRFLTDAERAEVHSYLAEKYGLEVQAPPERATVGEREPVPVDESAALVRAMSRSEANLNEDAVRIGWDAVGRMSRPLGLRPETADTGIHCSADGIRVRVTVRLTLASKIADARLRLLIFLNDTDYHPEEASSTPFGGVGGQMAATVRLQTELTLGDGDFFEIVTQRDGAEGRVWLQPGDALLTVERIE